MLEFVHCVFCMYRVPGFLYVVRSLIVVLRDFPIISLNIRFVTIVGIELGTFWILVLD
jgi:hypothetical protein